MAPDCPIGGGGGEGGIMVVRTMYNQQRRRDTRLTVPSRRHQHTHTHIISPGGKATTTPHHTHTEMPAEICVNSHPRSEMALVLELLYGQSRLYTCVTTLRFPPPPKKDTNALTRCLPVSCMLRSHFCPAKNASKKDQQHHQHHRHPHSLAWLGPRRWHSIWVHNNPHVNPHTLHTHTHYKQLHHT